MTFTVYCDSGANAHSRREETITLDDLGLTPEDWAKMDSDQRDEVMK